MSLILRAALLQRGSLEEPHKDPLDWDRCKEHLCYMVGRKRAHLRRAARPARHLHRRPLRGPSEA